MGQQSSEISSNVVADGLVKPVIAMVVAQIAYAAMYIFYILAADSGMNLSILVAYRLMFSSAIIVPLSLILERYIYLSINIYIFCHKLILEKKKTS